MASLLVPSSNQPRASQVLPAVKCSSCNQPVPISELGEHICVKTPPVSVIPKVSSPPPSAFNNVRPPSSRIPSPGLPTAGPPRRLATPSVQPPNSHVVPTSNTRPHTSNGYSSPPQPSQSSQPLPRALAPPNGRPHTSNGTSSPSQPPRSSPLARQPRNDTSMSFQRPPDNHFQPVSSLSPTSPTDHVWSDGRGRSLSSVSGRAPAPPTNFVPSYPGMKPLASMPGSSPIARSPPRPARTGERAVSFVPESETGIDTKIGGEAGMAGVGRRGFAAAARAAMFVSPSHMDRRPAGPPRHLDIDAASRSTDTPPLSASSGYSSHSPGPQSPGPQADSIAGKISPSSPSRTFVSPIRPPSPVRSPAEEIINGTGLSPLDRLPFFGKYKNSFSDLNIKPEIHSNEIKQAVQSPPDATLENTQGNDDSRLRYLSASTTTSQTYKNVDSSLYHDSDSDSEHGLAYADSEDENDSIAQSHASKNKKSSILRSGSTSTNSSGPVRFHGEEDRGRSTAIAQALGISPDNSNGLGSSRQRSSSASSVDTGSIYSRTTSVGPISGPFIGGAFGPTMETLLEEVVIGELPDRSSQSSSRHLRSGSRDQGIGLTTMSTGPHPHRSNTVQVPPHSPENKPPKLPARAKTTNDHHKSLLEPPVARKEKVRRTRVCLRCEKQIEDGRWIKVDTGGALCEKCWKNMYLPKCRRCQLPIERQAVSSSDGQLKGKYHKKCFNCHVCHQPFPDKSFYVYDGKPLCAYHYHEANDSLCAAARCGQPIEGPCAVSHTGDKYHPEHMICEYPGNIPCNERLTEYWEVEGRMLCEKHAASAGNDEEDDGEWTQTSKAQRRVTRFMNLGGGFGGASDALSDLL